MAPSPRSLASGSLIMLLALALGGVFSVVMSVYIARSVGVSDFGAYSIVLSVQGVVGLFASFSMGMTLSKFVAEYRAKHSTESIDVARAGLLLVLVLSTVSCFVFVMLSGVIGNGIYRDARVTNLIPFSALVIVSSSFYAATFGIIRGCQRIAFAAIAVVTVSFLSLCAVLIMLPLLGLEGAFLGSFVAQSFVVIAMLIFLSKTGFPLLSRLNPDSTSAMLKKIFGFSFPAMLSGLVIYPVYWIGNTDLALSASIEAVGYFAVAFMFFSSFAIVPQSIVIVMFPRLSELSVTSPEAFERVGIDSVRSASILMFPLIFLVGLFSGPMITLLYGRPYLAASEVVYFMIVASYFYALSFSVESIFASIGRIWLALSTSVVWAIVFVAFCLLLIPLYGANGLGYSFAGSYGIRLAVLLVLAREKIGMDLRATYFSISTAVLLLMVGYFVAFSTAHITWVGKSILLLIGSIIVLWPMRAAVLAFVQRVLSLLNLSK